MFFKDEYNFRTFRASVSSILTLVVVNATNPSMWPDFGLNIHFIDENCEFFAAMKVFTATHNHVILSMPGKPSS